jgi:sec-independent protein translocase protein TatA
VEDVSRLIFTFPGRSVWGWASGVFPGVLQVSSRRLLRLEIREDVIMSVPLAWFGMPGPVEMLIIALVILLLFGNRLPSVMRSLGKGIVEFKKGVQGIEEDVDKAGNANKEQ